MLHRRGHARLSHQTCLDAFVFVLGDAMRKYGFVLLLDGTAS